MFDFAQIIQRLTITIPPILLAVTVHEISHGWVAYKLGDPTAKDAGRLTFNPISHLDLFGTLAFLLTQAIGWAKPVPVNPRYFNHPRKDMIWVSLAGPASNILLAIVLAVILKLFFLIPALGAPAMFFLKQLAYMIKIGVMINIGNSSGSNIKTFFSYSRFRRSCYVFFETIGVYDSNRSDDKHRACCI